MTREDEKRPIPPTLVSAAIVMLVVVATAGCGKDLSRRKAKALLAEHFETKRVAEIPLSQAVLECGVRQGVFEKRNAAGYDFWQLTPAGKQIASDGGGHAARRGGEIKLLEPVQREVEQIQGIAPLSDDAIRQVNFTWTYDNLPKALRTCLSNEPSKSIALFRRYDDGWRVEATEDADAFF